MSDLYTLPNLGWKPFFQQQLSLADLEYSIPARIFAVHRSRIELMTESGARALLTSNSLPRFTVGDWLLIDEQNRFVQLLERYSCFKRKSAGTNIDTQLIAANVDTVFIVCSLNDDFNLNRIERYLSIAQQSSVDPVVVLSKADLCSNVEFHVEQVQALNPMLMVESVNSLDSESVKKLQQFCIAGNTVAVMGSSGVGKSTLINSLVGESLIDTQSIREDDSKGRHTTTARSIHRALSGGLIIDTPGMRELQLTDCEEGLQHVFADIIHFAKDCRFSDCEHHNEPGCGVKRALASGELDSRHFKNYIKLVREEAHNRATLLEKKAHDKSLSKLYRRTQTEARKFKNN